MQKDTRNCSTFPSDFTYKTNWTVRWLNIPRWQSQSIKPQVWNPLRSDGPCVTAEVTLPWNPSCPLVDPCPTTTKMEVWGMDGLTFPIYHSQTEQYPVPTLFVFTDFINGVYFLLVKLIHLAVLCVLIPLSFLWYASLSSVFTISWSSTSSLLTLSL